MQRRQKMFGRQSRWRPEEIDKFAARLTDFTSPLSLRSLIRPSRPQIDPPNLWRNWMKSLALTLPSPLKSKVKRLPPKACRNPMILGGDPVGPVQLKSAAVTEPSPLASPKMR